MAHRKATLVPLEILLFLACQACSSGSTDGSDPGAAYRADAGASVGDAAPRSGADGAVAAKDSTAGSDASHASADGAASGQDSASGSDAGSSGDLDAGEGAESGPTADELAWLTPQNAARAAVGEAPLVWDPIAAEVAQGYASTCTFAHNANRSSQYDALGGMGGLGENIAAGAPTQSVSGAVGSWVGEEQYYDHATNTCASGQECGHYTQIVWKGTTAVGCAKVSCTTGSPFGTFASGQWDFSVCDYSPPGNVVGQSPY